MVPHVAVLASLVESWTDLLPDFIVPVVTMAMSATPLTMCSVTFGFPVLNSEMLAVRPGCLDVFTSVILIVRPGSLSVLTSEILVVRPGRLICIVLVCASHCTVFVCQIGMMQIFFQPLLLQ